MRSRGLSLFAISITFFTMKEVHLTVTNTAFQGISKLTLYSSIEIFPYIGQIPAK